LLYFVQFWVFNQTIAYRDKKVVPMLYCVFVRRFSVCVCVLVLVCWCVVSCVCEVCVWVIVLCVGIQTPYHLQ
jgi:hypothetical protein